VLASGLTEADGHFSLGAKIYQSMLFSRRDKTMFLKHRLNHNLVEILNLAELWDPFLPSVLGRYHAGEEMQDPEPFEKVDLVFLSNELLPKCWIDTHYRDREVFAKESIVVLK
jgi:hypothetical protein